MDRINVFFLQVTFQVNPKPINVNGYQVNSNGTGEFSYDIDAELLPRRVVSDQQTFVLSECFAQIHATV